MSFKYYASHPGATNPNNHRVKYLKENHIGLMISAEHWGAPFTNYAVDNGAWSDYVHNRPFNTERYRRVLVKISLQEKKPDFIILPDIVRGGRRSLALSKQYLYLSDTLPCYLAIQDGITPDMISEQIWESIEGVFIGGSDVWKWRYLHIWTGLAHSHEKKNTCRARWNSQRYAEMPLCRSGFCRRFCTDQESEAHRHYAVFEHCRQRQLLSEGGV